MEATVMTPVTEPVIEPVIEPVTEKTVPYDRFATVISEKKALAEKLAKIEADVTAKELALKEKLAKDEGDYATLIAEAKDKQAKYEAKMNGMVVSSFMNTLVSKYGLAKPEYAKLFDKEVKVDGMEITNATEVETEFDKFRIANPQLFNTIDKRIVPTVDNKPVKAPVLEVAFNEMDKMSQYEAALKERRSK